jgi:hypothetical protein
MQKLGDVLQRRARAGGLVFADEHDMAKAAGHGQITSQGQGLGVGVRQDLPPRQHNRTNAHTKRALHS